MDSDDVHNHHLNRPTEKHINTNNLSQHTRSVLQPILVVDTNSSSDNRTVMITSVTTTPTTNLSTTRSQKTSCLPRSVPLTTTSSSNNSQQPQNISSQTNSIQCIHPNHHSTPTTTNNSSIHHSNNSNNFQTVYVHSNNSTTFNNCMPMSGQHVFINNHETTTSFTPNNLNYSTIIDMSETRSVQHGSALHPPPGQNTSTNTTSTKKQYSWDKILPLAPLSADELNKEWELFQYHQQKIKENHLEKQRKLSNIIQQISQQYGEHGAFVVLQSILSKLNNSNNSGTPMSLSDLVSSPNFHSLLDSISKILETNQPSLNPLSSLHH